VILQQCAIPAVGIRIERADIDQVGALPYRIMPDGSAQVMLITSRDTGRWVIPKGNPISGLAPHEAAAEEAFEEAGIRGIACPTPLGTFTYMKRRRTRRSRELTVAVFPIAVVEQVESWPEQGQRDTRWFDLDQAARNVTELQLKALIAGFREPIIPASLAQRVLPAFRSKARKRVPMVAWFQALMPTQGRFFDHFEAHAATLVAGADALAKLLHNEGPIAENIAEIVKREHEADDITREVLQDVRRVFVTPFDRSAITSLIGVMDDAIDQMNGTAKSIELYEVTTFEPQMRDMAGIVVEAARVTAEAIPLLRSVGTNASRLHDLTARLIQIEGHADDIHDAGLKALFKTHGASSPMDFIVGREIYSHLEKIVDRFEDVANEIQGLVIDHA
jgi:predicted phosphate transport protein (TIGR00153 family)